jgi:excisionase family DNA binding protein
MHEYHSAMSALAEFQRPMKQGPRPPNSIIEYLRNQRELWTIKRAARALAHHPETVYTLIKNNGLPATKDGRRWKIDPIRLADWLEGQDSAPTVIAQPAGPQAGRRTTQAR